MAEAYRDHIRRDAGQEEKRGLSMAQVVVVVESDGRQLIALHKVFETLGGDVEFEGRAVLLDREETRLAPFAIECHAFLELCLSQLAEYEQCLFVDVDRASATLGLRGREDVPSLAAFPQRCFGSVGLQHMRWLVSGAIRAGGGSSSRGSRSIATSAEGCARGTPCHGDGSDRG